MERRQSSNAAVLGQSAASVAAMEQAEEIMRRTSLMTQMFGMVDERTSFVNDIGRSKTGQPPSEPGDYSTKYSTIQVEPDPIINEKVNEELDAAAREQIKAAKAAKKKRRASKRPSIKAASLKHLPTTADKKEKNSKHPMNMDKIDELSSPNVKTNSPSTTKSNRTTKGIPPSNINNDTLNSLLVDESDEETSQEDFQEERVNVHLALDENIILQSTLGEVIRDNYEEDRETWHEQDTSESSSPSQGTCSSENSESSSPGQASSEESSPSQDNSESSSPETLLVSTTSTDSVGSMSAPLEPATNSEEEASDLAEEKKEDFPDPITNSLLARLELLEQKLEQEKRERETQSEELKQLEINLASQEASFLEILADEQHKSTKLEERVQEQCKQSEDLQLKVQQLEERQVETNEKLASLEQELSRQTKQSQEETLQMAKDWFSSEVEGKLKSDLETKLAEELEEPKQLLQEQRIQLQKEQKRRQEQQVAIDKLRPTLEGQLQDGFQSVIEFLKLELGKIKTAAKSSKKRSSTTATAATTSDSEDLDIGEIQIQEEEGEETDDFCVPCMEDQELSVFHLMHGCDPSRCRHSFGMGPVVEDPLPRPSRQSSESKRASLRGFKRLSQRWSFRNNKDQRTSAPPTTMDTTMNHWKSFSAVDGQVYYFNEVTGKTQWELPGTQ